MSTTVFELLAVSSGSPSGGASLLLRALGGVLFVLLVLWNRREAGQKETPTVDADAETA